MAVAASISGSPAVLAHDHLRASYVLENLGFDRCRPETVAELCTASTAYEQHVGFEGGSLIVRKALDEEVLALFDAVLTTADSDDCVLAHVLAFRRVAAPSAPATCRSVASGAGPSLRALTAVRPSRLAFASPRPA